MTDREPYYTGLPQAQRPEVSRQPVRVVLDNIRSAFNVGSIFRTADAGAVEHLYLCGLTTFPPNDKLAKTALGAFEYVPWSHHEETTEALNLLRDEGIPVIGVEVTDDAVSCYEFDWPQPVAMVFGHEVNGIHEDILAQCDAVVKIPMNGVVESLNVSVATGVCLYEAVRQRES